MGVDKSYGSGKSRSAANSRARQRAAAGNFTKGAKPTTRLLKKIAAENPVTGFIGGGVSVNKLRDVAWGLRKIGDPRWKAVQARADAKFSGTLPATTSSGQYVPYGQAAREGLRNESSSVFPRLNPFSGNTQTALINEIKQSLRSIQKKDMARGTRFIRKAK